MGGAIFGASEKVTVVVIIGPSGAGKSSVAKVLQDTYGFHLEKTVTTRPQRDVFDTDQQFVDAKTFQKMLEAKAFFGTLEAFGFSYGLPRFNPDNSTVLLLRAPAVQEFLTKFPQARIIEIDAPFTVLKQRLTRRGTADRINQTAIKKEMALGRSLATEIYDSSVHSAEEIAQFIAT